MKSAIQLPLKDEKEIIDKAKDWAVMHGVGMRSRQNFDEDSIVFAPFTLLPSLIKKENFQEVVMTQRVMSELMHRVAHDHDFLESSLRKTVEYDSFTKKLFELYTTVYNEGFGQELSLAVLRNDVMMSPSGPKQVEINTFASGFAWLGPVSRDLHRYVLREIGRDALTEKLPDNPALEGVCAGIVHAWDIYNKKTAVVMFLVEETTYNICDQRFMEFEIRRQQPLIRVIRRKFSELSTAKLGPKKQLFLKDDLEVAVVYMRTGYSPNQYRDEGDWETRLLIERSSAIKCPSVQYQLAGTKKVQQVLATPGTVERFITNAEDVKNIRNLFTEIYSLDLDAGGDLAYNLALKNPEDFVLKPQREGGGNNTYGSDIPNLLNSMTPEERQSMILMKLIKPVPIKNMIIQRGQPCAVSDVISELGIFSYVIGSASDIVAVKPAGHMLRTKLATSTEGGVASGYGALDSPFLV
ncbi:glutathione synthetase-like isoform X2 [Cimex lectularius]|uniref:Glutathione synthetase n=1 Tax=Cimex lectularius TaxID=79782 RepID=A0A8I6S4K2_CIMLE|nr:glutathione synthetase-like isoform X2 [Cimex lectularius]